MGDGGKSRPEGGLKKRIDELLDGSLGLNISPGLFATAGKSTIAILNNPFAAALNVIVLYVSVFVVVPLLIGWYMRGYLPNAVWALFQLQIYAALWCGWSTLTTRFTSMAISKTIDDEIIPALSEQMSRDICGELDARFTVKRLLRRSWALAVFFAVIAGCLIWHDLSQRYPESPLSPFEIIWWGVGWTVPFSAAIKVVITSRFYRLFAQQLEKDGTALYVLDPARSVLVASIASVSRYMLLFWFGIAIGMALVIPFGVSHDLRPIFGASIAELASPHGPLWNLFNINPYFDRFVIANVLVTGSAALGWGLIIVLRCEATLRRAVAKSAALTLRRLESEAAKFTARLTNLEPAERQHLSDLNALHGELTAAGPYKSYIVSGLSVLVPLVPFVSQLLKFF